MGKLLQVLVVEDSPADTQLLLEELNRNNYQPIYERVQTAPEFLAALDRGPWDVIISDYVLPAFSGPTALRLLRDQRRDIPFIVVSGTYGEAAAVDMMKAGAGDYLVKGNLSRLVPAIEREIAAVQSRRVREQAESARQFLAAIVESTDDAIYGKTLDGIVVSWNRAAERIFGYRADEIIHRSVSLLYPANRQDELLDIMGHVRRGEGVGHYETVRLHKDGHPVPVSLTVSAIKDAAGAIVGASVVARDITERRREERERTQLIEDLTAALNQVKTLSDLLPICSSCKRIRDDEGYWQQVETYFTLHADAVFTHSICPDCLPRFQSPAKVEA